MGPRMIALAVVVALLATGPLSPVIAQQAQSEAQPEVTPDAVPATSERPSALGGAGYNTAATVLTVAKAPFNVILCGVGTAFGSALFAGTLGTAHPHAVRPVDEQCRRPAIVTA